MQPDNNDRSTGIRKAIQFLWALLIVIAVAVAGLLYIRHQAGKQAESAAQTLLQSVSFTASPVPVPAPTSGQTDADRPDGTTASEIPEEEIDSGAITEEHRAAGDDDALLSGGAYIEPALNEEEMQKLIDSVANKTNDGSVIGVIRIPKTDTQLPIIGEWSSSLLKVSVCRYQGGKPNEPGNLVIIGHNYKSGAHFGGLKKLKVGDEVFLAGMDGVEKRYVVYQLDVVAPDDFSALSEQRGICGLSLMTCYQDGTNRLFVRCEQADQ